MTMKLMVPLSVLFSSPWVCYAYVFQQKRFPLPTKVQFLTLLGRLVLASSLLITYSTLFGGAVIFPEPALECLTFTT